MYYSTFKVYTENNSFTSLSQYLIYKILVWLKVIAHLEKGLVY